MCPLFFEEISKFFFIYQWKSSIPHCTILHTLSAVSMFKEGMVHLCSISWLSKKHHLELKKHNKNP